VWGRVNAEKAGEREKKNQSGPELTRTAKTRFFFVNILFFIFYFLTILKSIQ
jgi:hypothetical protein